MHDVTLSQFLKRSSTCFPSPRSATIPRSKRLITLVVGGSWCISLRRILVRREMQAHSSRIWTRVTVCISYDDNHYTMSAYGCMYPTSHPVRFDNKLFYLESPRINRDSCVDIYNKMLHFLLITLQGHLSRRAINSAKRLLDKRTGVLWFTNPVQNPDDPWNARKCMYVYMHMHSCVRVEWYLLISSHEQKATQN